VYGSRIVSGLAVVFGGMAAVFVALAVAYNPVFLAVAAVFGAAAYFVWYHASGRFARRLYRGVESQAQPQGGNAGPREEWVPPRDGQSAREAAGRQRRASARGGRRAGQRNARRPGSPGGPRREPGRGNARAGGARAGVPPNDGITTREAYDRLGLDPGADADAVRSAYRERVKEVHPDTDGGDEDEFKRVKDAYERLSED
jgi:hypothetical protein